MGNNLTCYMRIKVVFIIMAVAIFVRVGLQLLGYIGIIATIIDYSIPAYFVYAVIRDYFKIGIRIKCFLFDFFIMMNLVLGYVVLLVVVGFVADFFIGLFKYVIL